MEITSSRWQEENIRSAWEMHQNYTQIFLHQYEKKIQIITLTRGVNLVRKIYIFYLSLSYITTTTSKRDLWKQADTKSFMTLAFLLNRESHDLTSLRNSKYIHTYYLYLVLESQTTIIKRIVIATEVSLFCFWNCPTFCTIFM